MNKSIKNKFSLLKTISFIVLLADVILMISFILWGLLTTFKTNREFSLGANPNVLWWPKQFTFENYQKVFANLEVVVRRNGVKMSINVFWQIVYTLVYSFGGALLSATAPFLVAYACSKFRYKFNKVIDVLVIVTMSIPVVGEAAPMISLLNGMGAYDTLQGVLMQKFSFANLYYLIFYATLRSVSKEYSEAAHIDGASELQVMLRIIFPLVFNLFFTVFLLYFIQYWNDYQNPLLYMPSYPTLSYGIFDLTTLSNKPASAGMQYTPVKLAGCIILVVPILIIFLIFKKKIMTNLSLGALKNENRIT